MELSELLTIVVPSGVTCGGFVVSYIINKVEYSRSIQKIKLEKRLSDLYGVQKDVLEFVDMLLKVIAYPDHTYAGFNDVHKKIDSIVFCAGSEDAVKILMYIRDLIFTGHDDHVEVKNSDLIAAYILLAMQIKYDTTGIKTSAKTWYAGQFTTKKILAAGNFYEQSMKSIDNIVDELGLGAFLKNMPYRKVAYEQRIKQKRKT